LCSLRTKLVVVVKFKKTNVDCVVDPHRGWKIELISGCFYLCQDLEGSNFLVVQLLAWLCGTYISLAITRPYLLIVNSDRVFFQHRSILCALIALPSFPPLVCCVIDSCFLVI